MTIYGFSRLFKKYSNPFVVKVLSEGHYDEDTGEYVEGAGEDLPLKGAIMPLKAREIYNSGGRLTESDRVLYSLTPMTDKQKIAYKGAVYSVEAFEDYTDFADFHYYLLKAVSSFYAES